MIGTDSAWLHAPSAPPSAFTMSVPFGVYGESGRTEQMLMGSDGTYSIGPIGNPSSGQSGTYQVIDRSSIRFLTGPYASLIGALYPNYKGSTRSYIDVVYRGTRTSWEYYHA